LVDGMGMHGLRTLDFALHCASANDHPEIVRELLAYGANIEAALCVNNFRPLHAACLQGASNAVRELIAQGANLEARNSHGQNSLHIACYVPSLQQVQVVLELLEGGADPMAVDLWNAQETPLHIASSAGHVALVQLLMRQPSVIVHATNCPGETPLHHAGNPEVVNELVEHGANVHVRSAIGRTPLHVACQKGRVFVVGRLLDCGAKMEEENHNREAPLHLASGNGHLAVVDYLLDHGAKVDAPDFRGMTPLCLAIKQSRDSGASHLPVVQRLLSSGANVDGIFVNVLTTAATNGKFDIVHELVRHRGSLP
jgi:ankyrin repeat protein